MAEATEHVLEMFPVLRDAARRARGQPLGRPAADARARHGVHRAAAAADDRRAVAGPRADDRRAAPAARARHRGAGHDGHPRRAVGEPRAHDRGDRVLHGEGRDPVPRSDRRAPRTSRRAALGLPRRRRHARSRDRPIGGPVRARDARARVETPAGNGHDETPPAIRLGLTGVSKRFGGLAALTDVSLSAIGGEIVGFIGPNGAGKTTLFDTISGFTGVDEGTIILGEGDDGPRHHAHVAREPARSSGSAARSRTAGCSPRSRWRRRSRSSFERHLEVRDPVGAALHLPFVADAEADTNQKVEALLELLGITDFRDKLGRELSTGSRRIVDLACVLAHNPSVLLLDEPSSGIAQREAEALGPLLAAHPRAHRRDAARDRARRAAAARRSPTGSSRSISGKSSRAAHPTTSCVIRSSSRRTSEPPRPRSHAAAPVVQAKPPQP